MCVPPLLSMGGHLVDNWDLTETSSDATLGYRGPSYYAARPDKRKK
jgi:hypothetical protein